MAINEEITQAQQRAEQQIAIMQDEWGSEKHVVKNLEREKEAYRQDLEDALQNNRKMKLIYLNSLRSNLKKINVVITNM